MHHGYMLFLVRKLPSPCTDAKSGNDWLCKYAPKGYRLAHLLSVRDYVVESMGATQDAADRVLLGARNHLEFGARAVVRPESTYLALFASRGLAGVFEEVLVYEKAKHQVRSMHL